MGFKPKQVAQNNSRQDLKSPVLDSGNYPARLVQLIDLGIQPNYFDKDKVNHEVMFTYELVSEFCLDKDDNEVKDKPRWISERINFVDLPIGVSPVDVYNDQFRAKSKMVQRAKAFDPKGEKEFDFSEMLSDCCTVTIVQKKKKDGDLRNDVGSITPPMKGMTIPELVNPPKFLNLEAPDLEIFKSLPEWLQGVITGNLQYKGSPLERMLSGGQPEPSKEEEKKEAPKQEKKVAPAKTEEANDDTPW